MTTLFAGLIIGTLSLLPPGPITVSLVGLGAQHGRRASHRAGLGIAVGDVMMIIASVALVSAGRTLPSWVLVGLQSAAIAAMAVTGLVLIMRAEQVTALIERINRPFRTFWTVTVLSPWVFGGWTAMLLATPLDGDDATLAVFACGLALATLVYHLGLGHSAASLQRGLTPGRLRVLTRAGGIATIGIALALVIA